MTERELIAKIQILKQVEPEKDWVLATKTQILGLDETSTPFFVFSPQRLVSASLLILLVLGGTGVLAQNSLPGDFLYPLKKMTEKSQEVFVSKEKRPKLKLELANKRLEELTRVATANKVKKLAPAIEEFEASVSEAAKELVLSLPKDLAEVKEPGVKEIVKETKKLEENKKKIEALGVVTGTEELDNTLAQIVEREIEDLETKSLTERQSEILEEAKEDLENENYSEALEKVLILSQE